MALADCPADRCAVRDRAHRVLDRAHADAEFVVYGEGPLAEQGLHSGCAPKPLDYNGGMQDALVLAQGGSLQFSVATHALCVRP